MPFQPPSSPDPIADPHEYQQHMLQLVGEGDPAEIQASTPTRLRELVTRAGAHLQTAPADGEWSVYGCVAHLVDAEVVMSARYRWVLAEDEPQIIGYDQDLWVDRLHSGQEPVDELLTTYEPLRAANVALWRRTPEEQRARIGLHTERGPESYDLAFRMIAGHDRFHLAQAERALAVAV